MYVYHPELAPIAPPESLPSKGTDTIWARLNSDASLVQEVFRRGNGSFGFRYQAWVNFADAGKNPHHQWSEHFPHSNCITDSAENAKNLAEVHASECSLIFQAWTQAQQTVQPDVPAFGRPAG